MHLLSKSYNLDLYAMNMLCGSSIILNEYNLILTFCRLKVCVVQQSWYVSSCLISPVQKGFWNCYDFWYSVYFKFTVKRKSSFYRSDYKISGKEKYDGEKAVNNGAIIEVIFFFRKVFEYSNKCMIDKA